MTPEEALSLPSAMTELDKVYLPRPNRCDVVLTSDPAPEAVTRTAFVLPLLEDGSIVMANVRKVGRGLEIPGGHIEPGEDALAAARRECIEETGCLIDDIVPIGFLRMVSEGDAPSGYRYPHPLGCQQFFAARVVRMEPYEVNDECAEPRIVSPEEAHLLKGSQTVLWERAREVLRPDVGYARG